MLFLFDVDGTLIRSDGAGVRALARAFERRHGVSDAMRGIDPAGKTDPLIVAEMFTARLGGPPAAAELRAILDTYAGCLEEELRSGAPFRVLPGVREVLARLHGRGAPVGLCTGNTERGARLKLEHLDLWRSFAFGGYGSDHAERSDVVGTAIRRGEEHTGRSWAPAEVLVVGDTPRDIVAARAVGARAAAVATGPHTPPALAAHAPDLVFRDLTEMAAWLDAGAPLR